MQEQLEEQLGEQAESISVLPDFENPVRERWQELGHDERSCGVVYENDDSADSVVAVSKVALMGVQFRSERVLHPGTVRNMRVGNTPPRLLSQIRIISCRPRIDGSYDVKGEFF